MLWITTTPGSAVQSKGSMVCMIGGVGNLPSKIARTKSIPAIDAITSVGVTPYSILGAVVSCISVRLSAIYDDGHLTKCAVAAPAIRPDSLVMPGPDPGTHHSSKKMDCRAKPA